MTLTYNLAKKVTELDWALGEPAATHWTGNRLDPEGTFTLSEKTRGDFSVEKEWVMEGVYSYNHDSTEYTLWRMTEGEAFGFFVPPEYVFSLYLYPDVVLWVVTEEGMQKIDRHFSLKDGDSFTEHFNASRLGLL